MTKILPFKKEEGKTDMTVPAAMITPVDDDNVLHEADRVTSTDRQGQYGHPLDHFGRTAAAQSARFMNGKDPLFRRPMRPEEWPLMVAIDKLVGRGEDTTNIKPDTLVDVPGYCRTIQMCRQEKARRERGEKAG